MERVPGEHLARADLQRARLFNFSHLPRDGVVVVPAEGGGSVAAPPTSEAKNRPGQEQVSTPIAGGEHEIG